MKKRATIRDVAERAGVSTTTVSFVLNERAGEVISARVRARVLQAAEELEYHPSAAARWLARQRTHNLALVFYRDTATIANAFYSFVLQGIIRETARRQYNLLFSFVDEVYTGSKDLPQAVREGNTEGVLLMHHASPQMVADIRALGIPVAAIDVHPELADVHVIQTDDYLGSELATRHVLELGHRRVGFLHAASERASIARRAEGFLQATAGLETAGLFDCGELTLTAAAARVTELLASSARPTALVCANDELAMGALQAAQALGVDVPRELSLVGFDDIQMSRFMNPPLTTVAVDKEGMGRDAVAALVALVEGKPSPTSAGSGGVQLVVRQSTSAPGQRFS